MLRKLLILSINSINLIVKSNQFILEECQQQNTILMTFDDIPDNTKNTEKFRKVLNKYNIKGLFFINGYYVKKYHKYNLIKNLFNDNHVIGTHTFSHPALTQLNNFNVLRELYDNELIIRNLINKRPLYFRPPYFDYNENIITLMETFNYKLITANMNPQDWSLKNKTLIYNFYLENLKQNKSYISLLHAQIKESAEILEKIIIYIKTKTNITIVSPKECFGIEDYNLDNRYGPNLN